MEIYNEVSYELSRHLTLRYSTSFGQSTKLFAKDIQRHIFAIYGFVRIADEIVDTYQGDDAAQRLQNLEADFMHSLQTGYSANPIVHACALTFAQFSIDTRYMRAFFASMELDLTSQRYTKKLYETYIYGSAEVIGLMCLAVFAKGERTAFKNLEKGARALGAAYQKINFLRDIASDYKDRQRYYFPNDSFETFNEATKKAVLADIHHNLALAKPYLEHLPDNARRAVALSYTYYNQLLKKLETTPAETLKARRIRLSNFKKLLLLSTQFQPKRKAR